MDDSTPERALHARKKTFLPCLFMHRTAVYRVEIHSTYRHTSCRRTYQTENVMAQALKPSTAAPSQVAASNPTQLRFKEYDPFRPKRTKDHVSVCYVHVQGKLVLLLLLLFVLPRQWARPNSLAPNHAKKGRQQAGRQRKIENGVT